MPPNLYFLSSSIKELKSWEGYTPSMCRVENGISHAIVLQPGLVNDEPISEEDLERLKLEFDVRNKFL